MFGINRNPGTPRPLPPPRQMAPSGRTFPLDMPLLSFSRRDPWRLAEACEGTQIMGATGSAKSSSSGRMIAQAFLKAGFGGIVLCAKPGERETWERYAKQTGRSGSVVVFDSSGRTKFNFLDYELRRVDQFVTQNLVSLFMRIMEAASGKAGTSSDANGKVFQDSTKELLSNCFLALYSAYGTVRLADLYSLIETAPRTAAEAMTEAWQSTSYCYATLQKMVENPVNPLPSPDLIVVANFFRQRWATRSDRTRSSVEMTFSASAYPFLTGYMRELFCTTTNIIPEMTHEGAIIILDFPIKSHDDSGILAQHIFKYLWQRATERRPNPSKPTTRPVFCFADECQFFVSEYDMEFQSTARSSKACTVYITQNLPTYYARMGGANPQHAVDALLGNFQTKIFHQNLDATTNEYASKLVGQQWMTVQSTGTSEGRSQGSNYGESNSWGSGGSYSDKTSSYSTNSNSGTSFGLNKGFNSGTSRTFNQQVNFELLPAVFASLNKGGTRTPPEAIVMVGGRLFRHGRRPWMRCSIPQT